MILESISSTTMASSFAETIDGSASPCCFRSSSSPPPLSLSVLYISFARARPLANTAATLEGGESKRKRELVCFSSSNRQVFSSFFLNFFFFVQNVFRVLASFLGGRGGL